MVEIEGTLYDSDIYSILVLFKHYLSSKGINYLKNIKNTQENVMITCPFHKDGMEKKPSCGVSKETGIVHCFSCGTVRNFTELLSYCLGYVNDNGKAGIAWLEANIAKQYAINRDIQLNLNRTKEDKHNYISEQELQSYRVIHPYMFTRKLTLEIIDKFDVGFDKYTNCITFPVRDKNGNTLFIARRNVEKKIFNYPEGIEKPLYGIYEFDESKKYVIICESIINCLTCYVYGKQALALNGTGTSKQLEELNKLNIRTIYLGLDNDEAGNKGAEKIYQKLKNRFIIKKLPIPKDRDINDLSKEEFENLFKKY